MVVFYGSQTGTGEEFAGRLAKEGIRYHLKGMVADPEECDMVYKIINYSYFQTWGDSTQKTCHKKLIYEQT